MNRIILNTLLLLIMVSCLYGSESVVHSDIILSSPEVDLDYYNNTIIIKASDTNTDEEDIKKMFYSINYNIEIKNISRPYSYIENISKDHQSLSNVFKIYYRNNNIDPLELSKKVSRYSQVAYSEPVFVHKPAIIPNDSLYLKQSSLHQIEAEKCWDISTGSEDVIIAIVDSEIDWWHDDLMPNIYENPGETGIDKNGIEKKYNGIDDDNNGFIDDYRGWDFMSNTTYAELLAGEIKEDNNTRINDKDSRQFHGTLVAGVASAATNNRIGVASLGWNCSILPVKVRSDLGIGGREHDGILYAAMLGADVINCSWMGVGFSQLERDIIIQATKMGSLIVASAGNSGVNIDKHYYDNQQYVMYVGASDNNDSVLDYSDFGVLTSVFAPGKDIFCCLPFDRYTVSSGTSLSAPMVSGLAGLIKSMHPDWSNYQIWHQIRSCSDDIFSDDEQAKEKYYGRVNAYNSLKNNSENFSVNPVPGIRYIDYSIGTESGILDTYNEEVLKLTIKNYLAPAENLKISVQSENGFIEINDDEYLDILKNLQKKDISFSIKLADKVNWYDKEDYLLITYKSGDYIDFQLLKVNLAPPPKKRYFAKGSVVDSVVFSSATIQVKKIHSPDKNTCWGIAVADDYSPFYFKADTNGIYRTGKIGNVLQGNPVEIFALDGKNAYAFLFVNGENNTIWKTTNTGDTWHKIKLDRFIDHVPIIRFFNKKYGYAIANFTSENKFSILNTTDYGDTWNKQEVLSEYDNIIPVDFFNGYRSVISTENDNLYFSYDFGRHWEKKTSQIENYHFKYISVKTESLAAIVSEDDEEADYNYYYAYSSDMGTNWELRDNINLFDLIGTYPAKGFYSLPESEKYIFFGNLDNMIITDDDGGNWYPLDNDIKNYVNDEKQLKSFFNNGREARLWVISESGILSYLDLNNFFMPFDTNTKKDIVYHRCYPNPAYDKINIQFYTSEDQNVNIAVYDIYGRQWVSRSQNSHANEYKTVNIDVSQLSDGVYHYKIETKKDIVTGKFVVMKRNY